MKIKVIQTEYIDVEISNDEVLKILASLLGSVYNFNPKYEYIKDGNIYYEVKYHNWETEKKREATELDKNIEQIYYDISNYLERDKK